MSQAHKYQPKQVFEAVLIGKQIRYLRRIKDISQETLAKQVGVTVGWIGRIERGIHMPNIKLLVKIARAMQVKVKDLIPNELV
jgi:transcriptional regulator with XRE-family HTH domain